MIGFSEVGIQLELYLYLYKATKDNLQYALCIHSEIFSLPINALDIISIATK